MTITVGLGWGTAAPMGIPAVAVGRTARVWTLHEVLLFRVPPWPQPQAVDETRCARRWRDAGARGSHEQAQRVQAGPATLV
ncbi:MAG TPA: hypothetical protein VIH59_10955 [Candidatus Tectomicrobia bacterium]